MAVTPGERAPVMPSEVQELLAAWRASIRDAERLEEGSAARTRAERHAIVVAARYHLAVIRLRARLDQVEGARDATYLRLAGSREVIEQNRLKDQNR